ncbi:MAG TPA: hypothetical protein VGB18_00255, partial [Candidatus Thermoplasmatota archaeon]
QPPEPTDTDTGTPAISVNLEVQAELPDWRFGQTWTYRVERPGLPTGTFKMIVAEDRDDLWVVATNNRTQAVDHAVYSTNPMLGRISKETLSPYQSGAPVKMYQFPLADGKTWQATFFGTTMNFQANYVGDIDSSQIDKARNLPSRLDGFRVTATGGGRTVMFDYVDTIEWFTRFELQEADSTFSIRLSLADFESNYKGSYFFFRGAPDAESLIKEGSHQANALPPTSRETFDATVPANFKDFVALGVIYVGKTGTPPPNLEMQLLRPTGGAVLTQQQTRFAGAREVHFLHDVPGIEGKWTFQVNMTGTLTYEARVFGISKYAEGSI